MSSERRLHKRPPVRHTTRFGFLPFCSASISPLRASSIRDSGAPVLQLVRDSWRALFGAGKFIPSSAPLHTDSSDRSRSLPGRGRCVCPQPVSEREREMPCLCAPTTHSGSFRCHLHRSHSWSGRSTTYRCGEDLELSTASLIENSLNGNTTQKPDVVKKPVSHPPIPRSPSGRSPPSGTSRLRNVVNSSDEEDEVITLRPASPIGERIPTVKMATGTGGSFASAPGGRAAMFRMLKTGQSTSKMFS